MIKLKCIKTVVMNDGTTPFVEGGVYQFHVSDDWISIQYNGWNHVHMFGRVYGRDWRECFTDELEDVR
jgi:hypothetical protein